MVMTLEQLTTRPAQPALRIVEKPKVIQNLEADIEGKYFLLQYSGAEGHAAAVMRVTNGAMVLEAKLPDEDAMNYLRARGVNEVLTLKQEKFNIVSHVLGFNLNPKTGRTAEYYDGIGNSSYWGFVLAENNMSVREVDCSKL